MVRPADHVRASEAADTPAVVEQSDAVQSGETVAWSQNGNPPRRTDATPSGGPSNPYAGGVLKKAAVPTGM